MLVRIWEKQNPHSLYIAAACVILTGTLFVDMLTREGAVSRPAFWVLLIFTPTIGVIAIIRGSRFPVGIGLTCVAIFTAVSLILLSPLGDEQSAVASAQELPIVALYLGWFVPRRYGQWIMTVIMVLFTVAIVLNPLFHADGNLGVPTAVQTLIIATLCYVIGSILWKQSERQLLTDTLTGALNRKAFRDYLARECARSVQDARPRSLIVIDFDAFKALNDSHGHARGDSVLVSTVAALRSGLRKTDMIGRIGGDEFAILLGESDRAGAETTMLRLSEVAPHPWSWGIAQFYVDDTVDSLFARADAELYRVKELRR